MQLIVFAFSFLAALLYTADVQAGSAASADELKARYEEAVRRNDAEGAWRLFCKAATSDEIIAMYRGSVDDTINLPLASIALAPLHKTSMSIPHSVEPIGRLVFTYNLEEQQEPKRVSSFFYYGKANGEYCLALPAIP